MAGRIEEVNEVSERVSELEFETFILDEQQQREYDYSLQENDVLFVISGVLVPKFVNELILFW